MADYKLIEVSDKKLEKQWLVFPSMLYRRDPHYIRPLDDDVVKLFDKDRNKLLRKGGDAIRWLLADEKGKIVGRIAAFIDPYTAKNNEQPTGGCGFFDCINDQQAANIMFDACKNWLQQRGMEAMDGSINFGDRDNFWGVLVDGFHEPVFNMPYNFPYYKDLFENYGFRNYFNQYTYRRGIDAYGLAEKVFAKAKRIRENPDYTFESIQWKNKTKYAYDFMTIYNKAWGVIPGVKPITEAHALGLLKQLEQILDKRLANFGYYKGEPISFFIMMQDLNQVIKDFNGKLHLWNKLRLLLRLKVFKRCDRIVGRIFGIIPEHQGKGVDGAMVLFFRDEIIKNKIPYKDLQMNWIGDFNIPMMRVVADIGGNIYKTHVTYRLLFDPGKPFHRAERQKKALES